MKISLIAAMAKNRVIGLNGKMPWHLPADLKRFRKITMGSPVIMGRRTFEAIGKPLPGRTNIVLTRNPKFKPPECQVFSKLDQALEFCQNNAELFVIGGADLYQALLPGANYLYLTEIDKEFDGDTFFPVFESAYWREEERQTVSDDQAVDFAYSFVKLARLAST
jgi:dihydrofolate reductase